MTKISLEFQYQFPQRDWNESWESFLLDWNADHFRLRLFVKNVSYVWHSSRKMRSQRLNRLLLGNWKKGVVYTLDARWAVIWFNHIVENYKRFNNVDLWWPSTWLFVGSTVDVSPNPQTPPRWKEEAVLSRGLHLQELSNDFKREDCAWASYESFGPSNF